MNLYRFAEAKYPLKNGQKSVIFSTLNSCAIEILENCRIEFVQSFWG